MDRYDFSDSSCCFFFNITISPMRLVMSMVIILDATTVSVTARHGLHCVLLLLFFFPFSLFTVTFCMHFNKACNVPPSMPGVPVSEHKGQRVFVLPLLLHVGMRRQILTVDQSLSPTSNSYFNKIFPLLLFLFSLSFLLIISLSFHFTGPPVNVTCNIFINSFGSVTETTMVSSSATFWLISATCQRFICPSTCRSTR